MNKPEPLIIPLSKLSKDMLDGIIRDFVLREGTDYGQEEYSLEEKTEHVYSQLSSGKAEIYFDEETETCTIRLRE
jgi:uncharacterized protein YheU (UPF0270 family)